MKNIVLTPLLLLASIVSAYAQQATKDSLRTSKEIKGVTVTANKPLIEQKVDRMIVNVGASVTSAGATAMEVLEHSPGVSVDKDGNISLKGKDGVLILIDGRVTQLASTDLAAMLNGMSAAQIDQIEIMANPPAKYDAAGNAGVINIKMKKNKTVGYNGSVNATYSQGVYPKTNEGLQLNYRTGKVNLFANVNHNYRKNLSKLTIQRTLFNASGDPESYFEQESNAIKNNNWYSGKAGFDYFVNSKTTIGLAFSGFANNVENDNINETRISSAAGSLQSVTRADVRWKSALKNYGANLNFRKVYDTAGRELTAEADYITYTGGGDQFMVNNYYNAEGFATAKGDSLIGSLPQNISILSGKIDYIHPLSRKVKLEAGIKASSVRTDNDVVYDSVQYGQTVHDYGRSNHFIYNEDIYAAYATVNASITKKLSVQAGLRYEHTRASGDQVTTGQTFSREYGQLFPTAYLQYNVNSKHSFVLDYGRRIRRPDYESLNPFIRFVDRYTYNLGNPDLQPQLSNDIQLSHNYKNMLTTTLSYSTVDNVIQNVIEQKGDAAYIKEANIATFRQYALTLNLELPIRKWWTNSLNVNIFNNNYSGPVNGAYISIAATSYSIDATEQFRLSKTLTLEANGSYRSANTRGVINQLGRGVMLAGISKQVMKGSGNIKLAIRDIFYSQKMNAWSRYGNVDAAFQEQTDSRYASLSFYYRFGKGKSKGPAKRASGSAKEELERLGQ